VVSIAPVEENVTLDPSSSVVQNATVAEIRTVEDKTPGEIIVPVESASTVEVAREEETGAHTATVVEAAILKPVRQQKPRKIRTILDGLTPGQFTVYSLMWQKGEQAGEGKRLYGGGYRALCDLTGMSKRGIQNVVAELQHKGVISIHQAPGYHRTQFSVYQVLGENEVLAYWKSQGYLFALGKGKELTATVAA
jgi:hypothetical protein